MQQRNPLPCSPVSRHPLALAIASALALSVVPLPAALAADISVVAAEVAVIDNDQCSLAEAIENANDTSNGSVHDDCTAGNPSGADRIELVAASVYQLTAVARTEGGATGLPLVASEITINGNGATLQRAAEAAEFRLLQVAEGGSLIIDNLSLRGGALGNGKFPNSSGGGVLNRGMLTVQNSTVSSNRARSGGGIANTSTLSLSNTLLSDNQASYYGGAVFNYDGVFDSDAGSIVSVINSTLSGNNAVEGGGLYSDDGTVTLTNSTLAGNSAVSSGAQLQIYDSELSLLNVVVTAVDGTDSCSSSRMPFIDGNNRGNLFGDASCDGTADANLNLGPLADNGGPTQTHELLAGSAALDSGNNADCPDFDQRGQPRDDGSCDVGAFERQAPSPSLPFGDSFES